MHIVNCGVALEVDEVDVLGSRPRLLYEIGGLEKAGFLSKVFRRLSAITIFPRMKRFCTPDWLACFYSSEFVSDGFT